MVFVKIKSCSFRNEIHFSKTKENYSLFFVPMFISLDEMANVGFSFELKYSIEVRKKVIHKWEIVSSRVSISMNIL